MDIQIIPIVSEKANALSEKNNRFSFKVSPEANKYQIRDLIEELYDVKVVEIKTMNYDGKKKQRYTRTGIQRGKTAAFKKAIVTLAEGQTIDFYSNL
jgi:large subunit ribosomal protein L23